MASRELLAAPSPYGAMHMTGVIWQWCEGDPSRREWRSGGATYFDKTRPVKGGFTLVVDENDPAVRQGMINLPKGYNAKMERIIALLPAKDSDEDEFAFSTTWDLIVGIDSFARVKGGTEGGKRFQSKMLPINPPQGLRCVVNVR